MLNKSVFSAMVVAGFVLVLPGCYEDVAPTQQPQAQTAPPQQGPLTNQVTQGGGSALGGAKRGAENIAAKAEAESQRVADEADKINE